MVEIKNNWTTLRLVKNINQLNITVTTLYSYSKSSNEQRQFYIGLLKRGTCFLVCKYKNDIFFAPSKFIGYAGNTMSSHTPGKMTGIDTNLAISELLKEKPLQNQELEEEYKKYCIAQGFSPRFVRTI